MSVEVEIRIPGAGEKWNCPGVVEINKWLLENLPEDDYRAWWQGPNSLKSDIFVVRFKRVDDAIAYALKWT
jgi:hypothetical protein